MMSSRVLSRLLPVAEGDVSLYGSLLGDAARRTDPDQRRHPMVDQPFQDEEDPEALLYEAHQEPEPSSSGAMFSPHAGPTPIWPTPPNNKRSEEDEDVPESLLLEPRAKEKSDRSAAKNGQIEGVSRAQAQWKAAQEEQPLRPAFSRAAAPRRATSQLGAASATRPPPDSHAQATWLYTNATNLDAFLLEVYQYYVEHGAWSMLLSRAISMLTELFVFSFAMFLSTCIDYSKIPGSRKTSEVLVEKCMSHAGWLKNVALFVFVVYWLTRLVRNIGDVRRLLRMHDFYLHVLNINDQDIQTVSWVRIVDGLVKVQNANVATANTSERARNYLAQKGYRKPPQRLNAESIANRLMRQANYYVALYNKDILDFTLPLPFLGSRQFYSKSLEWCIDFCFTNLIFDEQGSIRPFCLDVKNRTSLVQNLQQRFQFAALTSIIIAPFNIIRFCILFFFRYYTEFTRNPSKANTRTFTPFAEWKIREFNELDHLFQRRIRQAHPFANEYLKQFPKDKSDQAWRFVAFVSGAIAAVLALATLLDPELFLGFEVTPGRTAVFWLTVMLTIFGIAQGSLPDENDVHDPVLHLKEVLMFTHYMPAHWKGRLHSNEVRADFAAMYQPKYMIFLEEILSLIVAPIILLRNGGKRCERIIDFFREHSVHVDGIGYQCNFAVFGFKKDLNAEDPTAVLNQPDGLRDDYFGLKDDKMAASVQNFMQYYSHYNHRHGGRRPHSWQPPPVWPPVLSTPAIAEEPEIPAEMQGSHARPASGRRSGVADGRPQRTTTPHRSPRQMAQMSRERRSATNPKHAAEHPSAVLHPVKTEVSESRLIAQDSDLQDYDERHKAKDSSKTETDDDDDDGNDDNNGPGLLGMLAQLRTQAEKGSRVHI